LCNFYTGMNGVRHIGLLHHLCRLNLVHIWVVLCFFCRLHFLKAYLLISVVVFSLVPMIRLLLSVVTKKNAMQGLLYNANRFSTKDEPVLFALLSEDYIIFRKYRTSMIIFPLYFAISSQEGLLQLQTVH
jgi:hypothetical protein